MEQLKSIVERIERLERQFQLVHDEQMQCLREFWIIKFGINHFGKDGRRLPLPIDRFINNISANSETNCMEWIGTVAANGYGHFVLNNTANGAHRWLYDLIYGLEHKNDYKWCLDHLCFLILKRLHKKKMSIGVIGLKRNTIENYVNKVIYCLMTMYM